MNILELIKNNNTCNWDFIADTANSKSGSITAGGVTGDGNLVFSTLINPATRSVFFYDGGNRYSMDTVNNSATLVSIADIVVPKGSKDVYNFFQESRDVSVMKHKVKTRTSENSGNAILNNAVTIYPNPSAGNFTINLGSLKGNTYAKSTM